MHGPGDAGLRRQVLPEGDGRQGGGLHGGAPWPFSWGVARRTRILPRNPRGRRVRSGLSGPGRRFCGTRKISSQKPESCVLLQVCGGSAKVDSCGVCNGNNKDLVRATGHYSHLVARVRQPCNVAPRENAIKNALFLHTCKIAGLRRRLLQQRQEGLQGRLRRHCRCALPFYREARSSTRRRDGSCRLPHSSMQTFLRNSSHLFSPLTRRSGRRLRRLQWVQQGPGLRRHVLLRP